MTFTSSIFLIGLLPWFILLYSLLGKKSAAGRAALLFLANGLFYLWGGVGAFLFVCLYAVMIWLFSLLVGRYRNRGVLFFTILVSVLPWGG